MQRPREVVCVAFIQPGPGVGFTNKKSEQRAENATHGLFEFGPATLRRPTSSHSHSTGFGQEIRRRSCDVTRAGRRRLGAEGSSGRSGHDLARVRIHLVFGRATENQGKEAFLVILSNGRGSHLRLSRVSTLADVTNLVRFHFLYFWQEQLIK